MIKYIIAIPLIATAVILVGMKGIEKNEKAECLKWQSHAKEYQEFYLTQWQKDQCDHQNIKIDAPVKQTGILDRMESSTTTPSSTSAVKPSQTPKMGQGATQTPKPTPTSFVASTPTPTPTPTPTNAPITATPAPTPDPTPALTPTPTPSPTPNPDKRSPEVKIYFAIEPTVLYYGNEYCRNCVLVVTNEEVVGLVLYRQDGTAVDDTLKYKGYKDASKVNGKEVWESHYYLSNMPDWNGDVGFTVGVEDIAGNRFISETYHIQL